MSSIDPDESATLVRRLPSIRAGGDLKHVNSGTRLEGSEPLGVDARQLSRCYNGSSHPSRITAIVLGVVVAFQGVATRHTRHYRSGSEACCGVPLRSQELRNS